jgi:hypothetical protein
MKYLLKSGFSVGVALLLTGTAQAAVTVYTSQASFAAAASGLQTDTFNDLSQVGYVPPLARSAGSVNYEVSASGGLVPGSDSGNIFMSTNTWDDPMIFSNFSTPIRAIGGRFFSSNLAGAFVASPLITLSLLDSAGTTTEIILNPTTASFRGFVSSNSITSLTVTSFNPGGGPTLWPSVDDLQVGGAVPEPASWALMIAGFGLVGGMMRRRSDVVAA